MNHPNEPTGNTRLADWLRRLLRYCIASELRPGVNYRVNRTANGTFLDIQPSAGTPAGGVACYRFKTMEADYMVCKPWDGSTEGSVENIAKPFKLRATTSETIDSIAVAYSSYNWTTQSRAAAGTISGTAIAETQAIVPKYIPDDLIFACPADFTGVTVSGSALTLIDVNADGRAWALTSS